MSPDWPKRCTPRQLIGTPCDRRQEAQRVRVTVEQRDDRQPAPGTARRGSTDRHRPRPARAWSARNSRSALVMQTTDASSSSAASIASGTSAPITAIVTPRRRPASGSRPPAPARGPPRRRAPGRSAASTAGSRQQLPSARPSWRQRVQERPFEVAPERRLPGDAAGLLDPDRRRDHRLVRAALRPERDAARRADEDRLAAGVDPERPRLERARDERVVDRADRQQRLPGARPRRAELAEQADEVDLGDPQLDVLAVIALAPAHRACRCRRRTSRCDRRPTRCRPC